MQASHRPVTVRFKERRGGILTLVAVCLPVLVVLCVFCINVAWMQLARTELRSATDAAARAGSRMLSRSQDKAVALAFAQEAARRNSVGGSPLTLSASDVEFGRSQPTSDFSKWEFVGEADAANRINAVRIMGNRSATSADGAVPMLFTGVFARTHFEPVRFATAAQVDRDVLLVLDRSGSMGTATPTGTRWSDLKQAVGAFLDALGETPQDEMVGVITYSTEASRDRQVTLDYPSLRTFIDGVAVGGATSIGLGVQEARQELKEPGHSRLTAAKTIVVMTDGNHNNGIRPEIVAEHANLNDGITVHTVTFSDGADQLHMQQVAAAGGGKHWHANDLASLINAFEEIADNLPTMITE